MRVLTLFLLIFMLATDTAAAETVALPKTLSLSEAIALSVRTNPNVEISQLSYLAQKFNTDVQNWEFQPHYSFQANFTQTRSAVSGNTIVNSPMKSYTPGVSIQTPIGTQVSLTNTHMQTSHYNPGLSLSIMQPLMRGFGRAVVESALNNAKDEEVISRLSVEETLRTTVTSVIDGYLDVVAAEKNVDIDQAALKRAQEAVKQTALYIKAGHKAGNEIVTVKANVATAQSVLQNDKNNLIQAKYNLLQAIGVDPNADITFSSVNLPELVSQYQGQSLDETKQLVLDNDIQYQIDKITLYGPTSRSLLVANDNTRWQLNLTATAATGSGSGGGENAGIDSLFNGANQNQSVGLTLTIPIEDKTSEQAVVNAKVALKQAELGLLQEKWSKETSAITVWNSVKSAEQAMVFAKDAEQYQEKTYQVSYQKYLHGLIDSLELQTAQNELISAQQSYLSSEIYYIKSLVSEDLLIGHTLSTWHVGVRLS